MRRVNIKMNGPLRHNIEKIELEDHNGVIDIRQDVVSLEVKVHADGRNTVLLELLPGSVDLSTFADVRGLDPTDTPETLPSGQGSGD